MFGRDFLTGDTLQWPFFSFSANPHLQLPPAKFPAVLQELESILEEYAVADFLTVRIITYRLLALLTMLERQYEEAHPSGNQPPVQRLVKQFLGLLETHYRENATVEYYAAQLHVTPQYLNIVCRKETGITAGNLIRRRLLLEARRLLSLTMQDVKEIAYELGFSDTSYFSRFFRRYTGQTPSPSANRFRKYPNNHNNLLSFLLFASNFG